MAKSRVETFREYRRSIISGEEEIIEKTAIDSSIDVSKKASEVAISPEEALLLKKYNNKRLASCLFYLLTPALLLVGLVIAGFIVF